MGCGSFLVVSLSAFNYDDLSLNPTKVYSFSLKMFEKNESKQKETGIGPLKCCNVTKSTRQ